MDVVDFQILPQVNGSTCAARLYGSAPVMGYGLIYFKVWLIMSST